MTGKQLKNSILQWAIQGKLVPQDPTDEPASVLLEKIRQEKERLIKEKKIKRDKNASIIYRGEDNSYYENILATGEVKCIDEEIPFEIPQGWEWERWGNISISIQYGYNAPALSIGAIKMVRISDIQNDRVLWDKVPFCQIESKDIDTYLLKPRDILFARTGGTVGKSFLIEDMPERAIYAGYLIRTQYSELLNPQYMKSFMQSQLYWEQLKNGTIATAQPNCNGQTLSRMLLPIPPQKEQQRIIDKLNKVALHIENYDSYHKKLEQINTDITTSLKKSILQEAIQGKLVPQIAEEGTAQELFEQIQEEKRRLVKEGKLRKTALATSTIFRGDDNKYYEQVGKKCLDITEEIPFEILDSWSWCHLNDIAESDLGKTMNKGQNAGKLVPYLCSINVYWNKIDLSKIKQAQFTESDLAKYLLQKNDLLICEGGDIGRAAIWDKGEIMYYQNALHRVRFYGKVFPKFFLYILSLYKALGLLDKKSKGMTIKHFTKSALNSIVIPLPPLLEQKRIIEKIDQLMQLLK